SLPSLSTAACATRRKPNSVVDSVPIRVHYLMSKLRALLSEFIGPFALIFVGIGAIKTAGHDIVAVALALGLTIAAFVSATLHISGGQLNPAVTFGLVCGGHMTWSSAFRYWVAQLLGGIAAAFICLGLFG